MNPKKLAAEKAVSFVEQGMTVGLGTGSTVTFAIEAIGALVSQGLSITAVASSVRSEELARTVGIQLISFSKLQTIDVYIDGADEIDPDWNLIKGRGGALLREKILAFNSKKFIVIADSSKLVDRLGKALLPVEVTPFAVELTMTQLRKLGCLPAIRSENGTQYKTDNGNLIIDCGFNNVIQIDELDRSIKQIPGVVEHGLFPGSMVDKIIVGYENGEARVLESISH
jgi:ribose 5-phosphate isomerase A